MVWIDGDIVLFKYFQVIWEYQCVLFRWWGEDIFIVQLVEDYVVYQLVEYSGVLYVCVGQIFFWMEVQIGEGLGFGNVIIFGSVLWNWFFRCWDYQFVVMMIQYEDVVGFCWGIDDWYGFVVDFNISQCWLGRYVYILQIVMDGLIVSGQFIGGGVQCYN